MLLQIIAFYQRKSNWNQFEFQIIFRFDNNAILIFQRSMMPLDAEFTQ